MLHLLSLVAALALSAPPPAVPYTQHTLQNGMQVLVHEDHRVPVVAVNLWVHVGSGDETPGKSGFAHLFEHMMFQGAKHIGEDVHFNVLREAGATGVNGTTNSDRTNYFEIVPSNQLETALWLESDRVGFLLDTLTEKSLQNQRDVVRNERRQRYDNVPYGKERFAVAAALYPEGHPYRYLTIGKHEDIEGAKLQDVQAFFRAWYTPKNITLALSGDITAEQAVALATKWFGGLAATPAPPHVKVPAPALTETVRQEVKDPFARLRRLRFTWHSPADAAPDDTALALLADILGAPGWGRLYQLLVVKEALAADVSVSQWGKNASGQFDIAVTLKPDADAARAEALLRRALFDALAAPPTADELRRAQKGTEAGIVFSLDDLMTRTETLQSFNHYRGDPGALSAWLAEVNTTAPADIQQAARRWLSKPRVVTLTVPAPQQAGAQP